MLEYLLTDPKVEGRGALVNRGEEQLYLLMYLNGS